MKKINTTSLAHSFFAEHLKERKLVVDATVGHGFDTMFLCESVGKEGKVIGFDIQEMALNSAKERLENAGFLERVELIYDSHTNMEHYIQKETVDGMMFNFGYLPKGDHNICTKPDTSVKAIELGLSLLKKGGIMTLCIYHGKDTGYEERDTILSYLETIPHREYTVLVTNLYNRPNDPPIFAGIIKE